MATGRGGGGGRVVRGLCSAGAGAVTWDGDSDDTRFRGNTATNTQPAREPDGNPELGAGADLIGAAGEAAGEGTTLMHLPQFTP